MKKAAHISDNKFSQKIVLDESFNAPDAEFDFKPVLSPPPEFFELRPVTKNLFTKLPAKENEVATKAATSATSTLPETTSPAPEYAEEDYNNYTEAPESPEISSFEVEEYSPPEQQEQEQTETQNYYQDYQQPRCQFYQHFTSSIFIQKCDAQIFCNYSLCLHFFGKKQKKLHVKCWWNCLYSIPVDPRHHRKSRKPVNTGIYSAFQRVTDVFDNLFVNG